MFRCYDNAVKDNSLLAEIQAEEHASKKARKYFIIAAILLFVLGGAGVSAAVVNHSKSEETIKTVSTDSTTDTVNSTGGPSETTVQEVDSTPDSTSAPSVSMPTPTASPGTTMDQVNAELCQSIIKGAQESANAYRGQYFDARQEWANTFAYRTGSAEAQDAKQFYIDHFKKLFNDLIARTNPMMQSSCKSSSSIESALVIPDFSAPW